MRFLILSYLTAERFAPSNSWRHIDGVKEQQEYVKYLSVLCSVQFIPHRKHANAGRPSSHTMPLSLLAFRCSGTLRTCWHDVVTSPTSSLALSSSLCLSCFLCSCIQGSNPDNAHWHKAQIRSLMLEEGACMQERRRRRRRRSRMRGGQRWSHFLLFVWMQQSQIVIDAVCIFTKMLQSWRKFITQSVQLHEKCWMKKKRVLKKQLKLF